MSAAAACFLFFLFPVAVAGGQWLAVGNVGGWWRAAGPNSQGAWLGCGQLGQQLPFSAESPHHLLQAGTGAGPPCMQIVRSELTASPAHHPLPLQLILPPPPRQQQQLPAPLRRPSVSATRAGAAGRPRATQQLPTATPHPAAARRRRPGELETLPARRGLPAP